MPDEDKKEEKKRTEYIGFCSKCKWYNGNFEGMCERCSYIEGTNQFPAHFLPNDGKWEKQIIENKNMEEKK